MRDMIRSATIGGRAHCGVPLHRRPALAYLLSRGQELVAPGTYPCGPPGVPDPGTLARTMVFLSAEISPRGDAELAEHVAQVPLDRAGADEQLGRNLLICQAVLGQLGDVSLLRGQVGDGVEGALAHGLPSSQELAARSLGKALRAYAAEHLVRCAELLARLLAAVLPAQPLAAE